MIHPAEAPLIFNESIYKINANVTVLLSRDWSEISSEERTLLSKILAALRLSLDAVQVITGTDFSFEDWASPPSKLIVFGEAFGLTLYTETTFKGIPTVAAEDLNVLLANENTRKQLWLALKSLFKL